MQDTCFFGSDWTFARVSYELRDVGRIRRLVLSVKTNQRNPVCRFWDILLPDQIPATLHAAIHDVGQVHLVAIAPDLLFDPA